MTDFWKVHALSLATTLGDVVSPAQRPYRSALALA